MKKTDKAIKVTPKRIPYATIKKAHGGDPLAIQTILRHYRPYITSLATFTLFDEHGNVYHAIDPEAFDEIENALITGILDFELAE